MRRRDRRIAEERILDLAAEVDASLARALRIVWAHHLPGEYAIALSFSAVDRWVLLCEHRWCAEPESRADTAAHELAHLHLRDGAHNPRWRRLYKRILRLAREMEWQ